MHVPEECVLVILLHFDVLFRCLRISSQPNCPLLTSTLLLPSPRFCVGNLLQYTLTEEQWNEPSSLYHTHKATEETKHNAGTIFKATHDLWFTYLCLLSFHLLTDLLAYKLNTQKDRHKYFKNLKISFVSLLSFVSNSRGEPALHIWRKTKIRVSEA